MKNIKYIFVLSLLFLVSYSYAQSSATTSQNQQQQVLDSSIIFNKPEVLPEFAGGSNKLMEYISTNIKYPEKAMKKGKIGTSYISFIVDKTGEVKNVSLKKGIQGCAACDEEALRVVKAMPKWIPGKQAGKFVDVQYVLPVQFSLK